GRRPAAARPLGETRMTTLLQLPLTLTTSATDLLLLEQQQSTNAVTLSTLLEGTQPLITIASETLLGRVSIAPGLPEPVGIGAGLVLQSGCRSLSMRPWSCRRTARR
ncbi:MAG TPA: hypothetical protein VHS58_01850, partial [Acetobacteraceae bacterium]|nr:hypothetical protein [Acetobacteraceae bacterium]